MGRRGSGSGLTWWHLVITALLTVIAMNAANSLSWYGVTSAITALSNHVGLEPNLQERVVPMGVYSEGTSLFQYDLLDRLFEDKDEDDEDKDDGDSDLS